MEENLNEGDYLLTTPLQQEMLALNLQTEYLDEEVLNEWFVYEKYTIDEFFERYNSTLFVITYEDSVDPYYIDKIMLWNDLNYLDIIYTNNLGEIVYKYNK